MQRASHQRIASRAGSPPQPKDRSVRSASYVNRAKSGASAVGDAATPEVKLSPAGTFAKTAPAEPDEAAERSRQLAVAIRQRIESRLPGRVRGLSVTVLDDTVMLEGRCATYYTKQLAQHAALGILDDEHLENLIVVSVPH